MAKSDRLSAEQQAVVGKLAGEYKDELTDLGVRVAALEKKTGRTSLLTELRVHGVNRYDNVFKDKKASHFETGARVRLNTLKMCIRDGPMAVPFHAVLSVVAL